MKKYIKAEIEVIELDKMDIITTSNMNDIIGGGDGPTNMDGSEEEVPFGQ